MEKAMLRAIPDNKNIEKLRDQKQTFEKQLEKAAQEKHRLIKSIAKGLISDDEAEKVITEIRERDVLLKDEIEKIKPQIANVPTEIQIKRKAALIKKTLRDIFTRPARLDKMSFEDKRKIVQSAFGGKDAEGNRYGVYLHKPAKVGEAVTYEIKGVLDDIQGQLPMSEEEIERINLFGSSGKKEDLYSKCHAHHGLCVYK
jgi:predicted transcriptional regulator